MAPFTSQVTDWLVLPVTVAVNGCWALICTLALDGLTLTDTEPCTAWPELGSTISGDTSTASELEPAIVVRTCKSLLSQRESGAPEMNHELPLSASIMP